jgi:polysaccharide biosynthesis protein PslJ
MSRLHLPLTWPLAAAFALYPVWWVLGVAAFVWPILAVAMLVTLVWRRWARAPVPVLLWLAFLVWVLVSGLQLHSGTRLLTFGYRFSLYAGALVMFLFAYNLPRSRQVDAKVLRILTLFWMIVVAGGFAGILFRSHTFTPPFFHVLPHGMRNKPFVRELVLPVFAQVQSFLGFPAPRPAAPFPYTNDWGGNIATLTFVALAALAAAGRGRRRAVILAVLVASVIPMVFSLNRGMFASLAIGGLYVAIRVALRGRAAALVSILAVTAMMVAIVTLTPLGHLVAASFSSTHGHSNSTRLKLYQEASAGVSASPWIGNGAPTATTTAQGAGAAIGTQGQLWMVLYSNGYPGLLLFVGFFVAMLWQTRRALGAAGLWLHAATLVALVQIVIYGWLSVEIQVVMVAAALAYRRCARAQAARAPAGDTARPALDRSRSPGVGGPVMPVPLAR